jgi:hypothetical protein
MRSPPLQHEQNVAASYVGKTPREGGHFWNAHCRLDLEASDLNLSNMPADSAQIALERVLAAVGQCLIDRARSRCSGFVRFFPWYWQGNVTVSIGND